MRATYATMQTNEKLKHLLNHLLERAGRLKEVSNVFTGFNVNVKCITLAHNFLTRANMVRK